MNAARGGEYELLLLTLAASAMAMPIKALWLLVSCIIGPTVSMRRPASGQGGKGRVEC